MTRPDIPPGFDFTSPELYASRVPSEEFAELRRTAPVWWNAQRRGSAGFDDDGYWAVTRHADILEVSRRSELYSSWENTALMRFQEGITRDAIEIQRVILLNIDPPEHTKVRRIVSRGFTPKAVRDMRDNLAERAERIVAAALAEGTGDFVTDVACELPLQAIAELIGIPAGGQEEDLPVVQPDGRRRRPGVRGGGDRGGDGTRSPTPWRWPRTGRRTRATTSSPSWSTREIDGEQLSSDEFGYFVLMLAVAGNETTRNAISHGMLAFFDHPDQWERYKAERPVTAVDEIIRWGTPVTVFQRTALADTELGGQRIKQGQRVGLFYRSANFDEDVFDHPERFDILRDPNPHVGLGGLGAHYCLGASLAKLEIGLIFNAIADAHAGHPPGRRAGAAALRLAQRHQAAAGQLRRLLIRAYPRSGRRERDRPLRLLPTFIQNGPG